MKTLVRMTQVAKMLTIAGVVGVGAIASPLAFAGNHSDTAQVLSSTPIYERVSVPRRECSPEQVTSYEDRRVGSYRETSYDDRRYNDRPGIGPGTILGAVIGGAVGRQFGNSTGGRDRGTAAGVILGGVIGNQVDRDNAYYGHNERRVDEYERVPVTRTVERCHTVSEAREEIRGYNVTYRYNGRDYTTRMPYDPGRTIQVDVGVRPVRGHDHDYRGPAPIRTY